MRRDQRWTTTLGFGGCAPDQFATSCTRGCSAKPRHRPKSPIATAIRCALNQWRELGRFLDDARVPLDNNASERSLRR
ncbi:MAG TPA: transposase, partial [Polyangiales bacterium]|nr:transposase [Polyangiales bacterium]